VAYEPNSLAGGCPFQAGAQGFTSFPQATEEHKVRGKPEKFAEHYNQARLFYESQSEVEKTHIMKAYRFELTRVQTAGVRRRVVAQLRNVSEALAQQVAEGLGMALPEPLPLLLENPPPPEVETSPALSLFARPGEEGIKTRRIAILVADGANGEAAMSLHEALAEQGAVPRFVGSMLGRVNADSDQPIEVEVTLETAPGVLWDAVVLPVGEDAVAALAADGHAHEFLKDQYRHCKTILALGSSADLLANLGISAALESGSADPGVLVFGAEDLEAAVAAFIEALIAHRHYARETDPPAI
jgi:catalase